MKRYGVRPSVRLIRPLQQRATGLLQWDRQVGDIDRLLHGGRRQHGAAAANAGSATFSALDTSYIVSAYSKSVPTRFNIFAVNVKGQHCR